MNLSTTITAALALVFGMLISGLASAGPAPQHHNRGQVYYQVTNQEYYNLADKAADEGDYVKACEYYSKSVEAYEESAAADLAEAGATSVLWEGYSVYTSGLRDRAERAREDAGVTRGMRDWACGMSETPPAPEPVMLNSADDAAAYWMQQAKDQYAAGDGIEACVSLRKSATLYSMLKGDYSQVNTDPDILKRVEENLQITSEALRLEMHCPQLAEEMTAAFAYYMAQVNSAQADKTELQGDDASRAGEGENACRLYSESLESIHLAEAWIDRMKTADSHDAVSEGFFESVLQSLKHDADEASGKIGKVCPAAA